MNWDFVTVSGPHGPLTEGPAWDGETILFTHIPTSRILRYDPKNGTTTDYLTNTEYANGLMFDKGGTLYACVGNNRSVVKYESNGSSTLLANSFEENRLNIPNDLAIDNKGRVWFTDPWYAGAAGDWSHDPETHKDLTHDSVYRLDPSPDQTWSITRVTFDTVKPNGILFSLDYKTLYVAEHGNQKGQPQELRGYTVKDDGTLGGYTVVYNFAPNRPIDGMCLDTEGNIVAPAGMNRGDEGPPIVYLISPMGEILESHPLPQNRPTNCTFGGTDLSTLYVTTYDGYLLKAQTDRQGSLLYPKPK